MKGTRRKYLNARDALATRLSQDQDIAVTTPQHVDFISTQTRGSYKDCHVDKYLFKDDSIINKKNDPLEFYEYSIVRDGVEEKRFRYIPSPSRYSLYNRGAKEGPFYYRNDTYNNYKTEKDEVAEREMIETNLTYDGYCVFLSILPNPALLHFKDSITLGINNSAKENISRASSAEELKTLHQDYLQLKAAAEYLFEQAEFEQEASQQEAYETQQHIFQAQQQEAFKQQTIDHDIVQALKDFEQ